MKKSKPCLKKVKESTKETTAQLIKEIVKAEGIINAIGDGVSIVDRTFKVLFENDVYKAMIGDHVGKHCYKAYTKKQGICGGCPVALTFRDGTVHIVQRELQSDKGTRCLEITASPLKDSTGNIIAAIEVVRDITERKQAEAAVIESERKLKNIIEHSNELYYTHDTHHVLSYASPQSLQILGYTPEEMMIEWTRLTTDNPINKTGMEITERALKTGEKQNPYLLELYKNDGSKVLLEIDESPVKDNKGIVVGIVGAARDVTARMKAEVVLQQSEEKFRSLAEQSPNMIFINYKGRVVYANQKCEEIMGYTKDEFYSERFDFRSLIASEYLDLILSAFQKHMQGEEVLPYEYAIVTKTGKRLEVIITTKLIDYENDKAILGIITDITKRKINEKEMRNSKAELSRRIKELEDFYDMAIGRELRMIELKKEIKDLKEELEKYKKS